MFTPCQNYAGFAAMKPPSHLTPEAGIPQYEIFFFTAYLCGSLREPVWHVGTEGIALQNVARVSKRTRP